MDFVNTELVGNKHLFTVYCLNPFTFTSGGFFFNQERTFFVMQQKQQYASYPFPPDCTGAMSLPLMARYKVSGIQLDSTDPQIYVMCN